MVAVAFGLLWGGYTGLWWGWSLLNDRPVTLRELVWPGKYPYGAKLPPKGPQPAKAAADNAAKNTIKAHRTNPQYQVPPGPRVTV